MDEVDQQTQLTMVLKACRRGEDVSNKLLPLVYDQLRSIAQRRMMEERRDHTLQATALVHEAYLKLLGPQQVDWQGRAHFYAAAAEAMRRILIDHARMRKTKKRGGHQKKVPLDVLDLAADADPDQILALDDALTQLEKEDARAASVVRLRFFGGLSVEDTADCLEASPRTVMREWSFARARLFELISK